MTQKAELLSLSPKSLGLCCFVFKSFFHLLLRLANFSGFIFRFTASYLQCFIESIQWVFMSLTFFFSSQVPNSSSLHILCLCSDFLFLCTFQDCTWLVAWSIFIIAALKCLSVQTALSSWHWHLLIVFFHAEYFWILSRTFWILCYETLHLVEIPWRMLIFSS